MPKQLSLDNTSFDQPRFDRPLTTVDIVVFALFADALHVLVVKRKDLPGEPYPNGWALPGGFIDTVRDISLEACAQRKLLEKTAINHAYIEQLGGWGNQTRDPRGWSSTHSFFALLSSDHLANLRCGGNAAELKWIKVTGKLKEPLAFDHALIVEAAVERLRGKVEYTSLPAFLIAREFTLSELQRAFEIVLDRKLEKSAFRTRVLSIDLVAEVPRFREGANRPAQLYKLQSAKRSVFFQRTFKPNSDYLGVD